ncbi:MAG TPA: protein translocase subunit SecD [Rhodospirillaceae bacterium]|jgi:protein-export membrane protein SecD|nr:protein translocase subunit SecD [Alphaproteobacteria bacterium]HBH26173.1 protein translocase subunit SecD [Rhodospirillaceae bacterium]
MVTTPRWHVISVLLIALWGLAYATPNVLPALRGLPGPLPHKTVNLGLDLRGGAYLLYEVDIDALVAERAQMAATDVQKALREAGLSGASAKATPGGVEVDAGKAGRGGAVTRAVRGLGLGLEWASETKGSEKIFYRFSKSAVTEMTDTAMARSIEIVRRRVDEVGTTEPSIQRQGERRILLQVPGTSADDLKRVVGQTAKLGFHLVEDGGSVRALRLPMADDPEMTIPVARRAMVTGDMLVGARGVVDPQTQEPVVSFRLNGSGAKRFCQVTRANVGTPFAIVLDGTVVSAPVIRSAICAGSGQIEGGFTLQEAADLALLLRAGALPAPMQVVEERSVGPSLGADSVRAGAVAGALGLALVLFFMAVVYGAFGLMACAALLVNIALIFAILSALQATLTLPGIAGIVLTIGMAVDANVLVFERIREERRAGRSWLSAVDEGYRQSVSTITDANLTTLLAAIILFSFGTGPIKGFAVTLGIGIVTSVFTALGATRLMVVAWARARRGEPKKGGHRRPQNPLPGP